MTTALITTLLLSGLIFSNSAHAGGGGGSPTCNQIDYKVLNEVRVPLLDRSGEILVRTEYNVVDCTPRGQGYIENIRVLLLDLTQKGSRNVILFGRETIGNPWIGQGKINTMGSLEQLLNFCTYPGIGHTPCSARSLGVKNSNQKSEVGIFKDRTYEFFISGENIPFTKIDVVAKNGSRSNQR